MKKNLFAGLMLAGLFAAAQTPRLSLYEEFTGETCPPCAATNPGLNAMLLSATNATKIIAIKWQVPIPSAPSATWSLYQTNKTEIDWRWHGWNGGTTSPLINAPTANGYGYPTQQNSSATPSSGINSAPQGRIDGQHQWVFGATSDHPANLTNAAIATAQANMSPFSVTMTRAWDPTYSSVNLTITVMASMNFTCTGPLIFRNVMVERLIQFSVQPGTNGEKNFEDAAIKSFPTIQAGTPLTNAWLNGQTTTFTMNCPLPSYVRDKSEVAFVGFIQDDSDRKVHQAVRANSAPMANDAKAMTALLPSFVCSSSLSPTITIKNNGNTTITGMTITPYIDVTAQPDNYWSGSLAPGASVNINLNAIPGITAGSHNFLFDVSGVSGTDVNLANNKASGKFMTVLAYQGTPVVEGFVPVAFPPANWATQTDASSTWVRVSAAGIGGFGTSNESAKLDLFTLPNGSIHELYLPPLTFSAGPTMSFDVAYAQYAAENDMLEVMYSTNCGQTWATVYNKAGSTLSTSSPVTSAFTPNSTQWRKEVVTFPTGGNMLVKFKATSAYGNNMYLDNINLLYCVGQTVSIASTASAVCKGTTVVLSASGANSYMWSNSQTTASISVQPSVTTTYTVFSSDPSGCSNSASYQVNVKNQPVTIVSTKTAICAGEKLILTATGATSYKWNNNAITPTISVQPSATTSYTVQSTDASGCGDIGTFQLNVNACLGITRMADAGISHELYPNPSTGEFVINGNFNGEKTLLTIYSVTGQKVFEQTLNANSNAVKCNLAKGVYQYQLMQGDDKIARGKLVME